MDLTVGFTLEDLQHAYLAFMTVTALRGTADVGVSATCQVLQHHDRRFIGASASWRTRTDRLLFYAVSDGC